MKNWINFVFLFIVFQVYIANRYIDQCPVSSRIPQYLYIDGVLSLIIIGLTVVLLIAVFIIGGGIYFASEHSINSDRLWKPNIGGAIFSFCYVCIMMMIRFFYFIWFISGFYWVLSQWNTVQYVNPTHGNYCHPFLYRCAYCSIFMSLFYSIGSNRRWIRKTFFFEQWYWTISVIQTCIVKKIFNSLNSSSWIIFF